MGIQFRKCYTSTDYEQVLNDIKQGNFPKGCIFKLHGWIDEDKNNRRFNSILITLKQLTQGSFVESSQGKTLAYYYKNHDFCFMGYSCRDDFTIFPILVNKDNIGKNSIVWFQYSESYDIQKSN
ncbi:MAG: hypothetical protein KatS3mg003_1928 [Candidatus Nitrosocaldaceae archaeon]|nr:MAG: hypothetical protein KatS3mg003_1928 [Candidatus Nitrosocaldaceae archaeon]